MSTQQTQTKLDFSHSIFMHRQLEEIKNFELDFQFYFNVSLIFLFFFAIYLWVKIYVYHDGYQWTIRYFRNHYRSYFMSKSEKNFFVSKCKKRKLFIPVKKQRKKSLFFF